MKAKDIQKHIATGESVGIRKGWPRNNYHQAKVTAMLRPGLWTISYIGGDGEPTGTTSNVDSLAIAGPWAGLKAEMDIAERARQDREARAKLETARQAQLALLCEEAASLTGDPTLTVHNSIVRSHGLERIVREFVEARTNHG